MKDIYKHPYRFEVNKEFEDKIPERWGIIYWKEIWPHQIRSNAMEIDRLVDREHFNRMYGAKKYYGGVIGLFRLCYCRLTNILGRKSE